MLQVVFSQRFSRFFQIGCTLTAVIALLLIFNVLTAEASLLPNGPNLLEDASDTKEASLQDSTATNSLYIPFLHKRIGMASSIFGLDIVTAADDYLIDVADSSSIYWLRSLPIQWSAVEPVKGQRNWEALAEFERGIKNINRIGARSVVIVQSTPDWAQKYPGYACGPIRQDEFESFANFMADLVARYSVPPYEMLYWEIWNEPDIQRSLVAGNSNYGCWGEPDDPYYGGGYYGEMLKVIAPRMRAVNPDVKIMVGGLLLNCNPTLEGSCIGDAIENAEVKKAAARFLEGILRAGAGFAFDGVSFHAYDFYYNDLGKYGNTNWLSTNSNGGPLLSSKSKYLRDLLDNPAYKAPGKFLMSTEIALLCESSLNDPEKCSQEITSDWEQTKAYYLTQSYVVAHAEQLELVMWYTAFGWRNSELIYKRSFTYTYLPAYTALRVVNSTLRGAQFSHEITSYDGVKAYAFTTSSNQIWIVWSIDRQEHTMQFTEQPLDVHDALGQSLLLPENATGPVLTVSPKPIYLMWPLN